MDKNILLNCIRRFKNKQDKETKKRFKRQRKLAKTLLQNSNGIYE